MKYLFIFYFIIYSMADDYYKNDCFNSILTYKNKKYISYDIYGVYTNKIMSPRNFISNISKYYWEDEFSIPGINIISDDVFCGKKCNVYIQKINFNFKIKGMCFLENSYIFWIKCGSEIFPIQLLKFINIEHELYINEIIQYFNNDIIAEIKYENNVIILPNIKDIIKIERDKNIHLHFLFENIIIYSEKNIL
ncbi:hypothetical protein AHEV_033 [Adoxophyes honmai entomopoxvirus 'L']|uniref:Uncharacterized protein n=1 Tax=Adoxophyes honmai entomopoxvirus 'L' TaxID=1293540 RepID=A0A916KNZ7_9POXV|nr:hypothetical protein AHEV_033 [Adoxophyes honmai entomopoxvirus 'L']CCU55354.1 hypothetical protein AHEV_033 [Adoxophyes honmai entomopoxvirus 'L']